MSQHGLTKEKLSEITRSVTLSSAIQVCRDGKIYRIASFIHPASAEELRSPNRDELKLLGCCEFANENYA